MKDSLWSGVKVVERGSSRPGSWVPREGADSPCQQQIALEFQRFEEMRRPAQSETSNPLKGWVQRVGAGAGA